MHLHAFARNIIHSEMDRKIWNVSMFTQHSLANGFTVYIHIQARLKNCSQWIFFKEFNMQDSALIVLCGSKD